ncbi:Cell division protein FtsZ [archaeon HR06]|nr:Cell division protein FtsZ [archaeon HR06]
MIQGVIGLGTAGCKILKALKEERKDIITYGISFDEEDLKGLDNTILIKTNLKDFKSIYKLRGIAKKQLKNLDFNLSFAFIVSGLGGKVGSSLSPLVCEKFRSKGIPSIFIGMMPFKFEKSKHFLSGRTLEYIRRLCNGIILIDNDELLDLYPNLTLQEAYSLSNRYITSALSLLLDPNKEGWNLRKLFLREGYTLLTLAEEDSLEGSLEEALKKLYSKADIKEIKDILALFKGKISLRDLEEIYSILSNQGEANIFVAYDNKVIKTLLLANGLTKTKFSYYDPLQTLDQIDPDYEYSIGLDEINLSYIE